MSGLNNPSRDREGAEEKRKRDAPTREKAERLLPLGSRKGAKAAKKNLICCFATFAPWREILFLLTPSPVELMGWARDELMQRRKGRREKLISQHVCPGPAGRGYH